MVNGYRCPRAFKRWIGSPFFQELDLSRLLNTQITLGKECFNLSIHSWAPAFAFNHLSRESETMMSIGIIQSNDFLPVLKSRNFTKMFNENSLSIIIQAKIFQILLGLFLSNLVKSKILNNCMMFKSMKGEFTDLFRFIQLAVRDMDNIECNIFLMKTSLGKIVVKT